MDKRHLELSHEEIQILEDALNHYYISKLNLIKNNDGIITPDERKLLISDANKYDDLRADITGSHKDV